MGGPVLWAGKPHAAAYEAAFEQAAALRGGTVAAKRVLAIGDSVRTDLAAAQRAGIDALFIASGLQRDEIMRDGVIDEALLRRVLHADAPQAKATMTYLEW